MRVGEGGEIEGGVRGGEVGNMGDGEGVEVRSMKDGLEEVRKSGVMVGLDCSEWEKGRG